ncbi:hypothetical protein NWF32_19475 [Pseudomonas qingdaonensis]|nr:hypothetical protein [Pseudomonas qingdaonensis]
MLLQLADGLEGLLDGLGQTAFLDVLVAAAAFGRLQARQGQVDPDPLLGRSLGRLGALGTVDIGLGDRGLSWVAALFRGFESIESMDSLSC